MPSQKDPERSKPQNELTTEEAIERLFPKPVIERVKRDAHEAPAARRKIDPKSMSGS